MLTSCRTPSQTNTECYASRKSSLISDAESSCQVIPTHNSSICSLSNTADTFIDLSGRPTHFFASL